MNWDEIISLSIMYALYVPDSWESNFMPEKTVIPCLHDTVIRFCMRMKISCFVTVTRVNLHWYDSLWCEILCQYHVNEEGHNTEPE